MIYCNNEAMFHSSKWLPGSEISGAKNVKLNVIGVENVIDYLCGEKDLYHFSQQTPYQIGYCMNMIHEISTDFRDVIIGNNPLKINIVCSKTAAAFEFYHPRTLVTN